MAERKYKGWMLVHNRKNVVRGCAYDSHSFLRVYRTRRLARFGIRIAKTYNKREMLKPVKCVVTWSL